MQMINKFQEEYYWTEYEQKYKNEPAGADSRLLCPWTSAGARLTDAVHHGEGIFSHVEGLLYDYQG